mgnify:CR=1 FL=1|tara:strand:+ start:38686 stop:39531 length:846 start_codon:yes stop_codon:yes gene_type:complete
MIYDSVIFTGESSLSGCSSDFFHTDNFLELNREAVGSAGLFYYDRANSTGDKRLQLSLNSQTLLQEVPITGQAANEISYQINTGDYFVKGTEADIIDINRVFFHNTVPAKSTSNILYNIISGSAMIAARGDFGQTLVASINSAIGSDYIFEDMDYFLNGQKVYSGDGVGVEAATVKTPLFNNSATANGIVTADNKSNFVYTAYKKRFRSNSITGSSPDLTGSGFIEGRTNFYINGMVELPSSYLELYTGVNIIQEGKPCLISGGIAGPNFEVTSKVENLIL